MDIAARLSRQKRDGLYRQHRIIDSPQQVDLVIDGRSVTSFCSNDYLGLANHATIRKAFIAAVNEVGVGAGAAHLISGHHRLHQQLETRLAEFLGYKRALLFSTGYMANVALMTVLAGRHDVIYQDRFNHASLIDGALMSRAELRRYAHGDVNALEKHIDGHGSRKGLIATDGVFSMEGDVAPLARLALIADRHQLLLVVDEAHGLGTMGEQGRGSVNAAGLAACQIPVVIGTLGKALGTFGAFVAASDEIIEALIQFAHSYVYTTASPPAIAAATLASLDLLEDGEQLSRLQENIAFFQGGLVRLSSSVIPTGTAIQPILFDTIDTMMQARKRLEAGGFLVGAIRPPTVPAPCLRITLTSEHTRAQLSRLLDCLSLVLADE